MKSPRRSSSNRPSLIRSAAILLCSLPLFARAETWNLGVGGSWNLGADWNPATVPNSIGASAIFNDAASAANPAQTANRVITLDASMTVGSLLFNNDAANAFTNAIQVGTGGALIFDEVDAGPATIFTNNSAGTGNNTITAGMTLNDDVYAYVNQINPVSTAGSLNLTGSMAGVGGFTKFGDGLATFGTGAKSYTGATALNGGRMRISFIARPSATSSFTLNAGAQLTMISANPYDFGPGIVHLNGSGPTSGPFAAFPGAIRNDSNLIASITNVIDLQSNSVIHVQGATGNLTLTNTIGGIGSLTLGAVPHDAALGTLTLAGAGSYSGGTIVAAGNLLLSSSLSSLGSGDVLVKSANVDFGGSMAKLTISSGVLNAISDSATLLLAGGRAISTADDGFIDLGAGINETVGNLVLGGISQIPGTYGSSASGATFKSDEYFSGAGIVTVVPEPASALMLVASLGMLATRRRRA